MRGFIGISTLLLLLSSVVPAAAQNQRFVWRPNFTAQRQNIPPRVPTYEQYWQSRGSFGPGNQWYNGNQNPYQYQNQYQSPYGGGYVAPSGNYPIYRPSTQYYQGSSYRTPARSELRPVHQFVHPHHGDQMLSLRPDLEPALSNYISQGAQFHVSQTAGAGGIPLYRYLDDVGAMHSFTTSSTPPPGTRLEGVVGYIYAEQQPDTVPLYGWIDACCNRYMVSIQPQVDTAHDLQRLGVLGYVVPC